MCKHRRGEGGEPGGVLEAEAGLGAGYAGVFTRVTSLHLHHNQRLVVTNLTKGESSRYTH